VSTPARSASPTHAQSYDYLIATGAHHQISATTREPLAPGLKNLEDALEIRRRVLLCSRRGAEAACGTSVIVGGVRPAHGRRWPRPATRPAAHDPTRPPYCCSKVGHGCPDPSPFPWRSEAAAWVDAHGNVLTDIRGLPRPRAADPHADRHLGYWQHREPVQGSSPLDWPVRDRRAGLHHPAHPEVSATPPR
jgi:hypothetical protein